MRALPLLLLFVPAVVIPAAVIPAAIAQDDLLPPDEVADLVDRYVDRGIESFREGSFDEAELRFKKALKRDPKSLRARMGLVRCRMALGG